jgi:hypothetical protein
VIVVLVAGDGETASASVSAISVLPTPAAIRITTPTITQNHQRFQNGVARRRTSGGGGNDMDISTPRPLPEQPSEPSTGCLADRATRDPLPDRTLLHSVHVAHQASERVQKATRRRHDGYSQPRLSLSASSP